MLDCSKYLWAKKSDENYLWLPLYVHMVDTANVLDMLYNHWIGNSTKRTLIDNTFKIKEKTFNKFFMEEEITYFDKEDDGIDEEIIRKMLVFAAMMHDFGKATPLFQLKYNRFGNGALSDSIVDLFFSKNMASEKLYSSVNKKGTKVHHSVSSQKLMEYYGVSKNFASIAGAHHGKPISNEENFMDIKTYEKLFFGENEYWKNAQDELFDLSLEKSEFENADEIPVPNEEAQVIITGLITMSDWIASNEDLFSYFDYDCENFEIVSEDKLSYRALRAWNKLNLPEIWEPSFEWRFSDLYDARFGLSERGFKPFPTQKIVQETAKSIENPGIMIIEAGTGTGKTEAALVAGEIFAEKVGADGIFFALPTQATSDNMFGRIKSWMEKLDDGTHSIRLAHGKAEFNEDYVGLFEGESFVDSFENPENLFESGNVTVHQWFNSSKKSLLDEFVVGTIDQLLLAALKRKHFFLRHFGLVNKVVIIDECHAYDSFMDMYLKKILNWLGAYKVPVIVLSATLPEDTRRFLIESYRNRAEDESCEKLSDKYAYPLITYTDGDGLFYREVEEKTYEKTVSIFEISEENLVELLKRKTKNGGCAGVILNTVKKAQEVFEMLSENFEDEEVVLFHAQFVATDRAKIQSKILDELGKNMKNRPKRKIVVATQVVEQSLDIDFDIMITELCPMDLLIQRIGRLQRFSIERKPEFVNPQVYILNNRDEPWSKGSESVYGEYLLYRTRKLLKEKIVLERDIPKLVQETYKKRNIEDMSEYEAEIYSEYVEKIEEKESRAKVFQIDAPSKDIDSNIVGFLKMDSRTSDREAEASVRDGLDNIEVILVDSNKNGELCFFEDGNFYTINPDILPDEEIAKKLARRKIYLPGVLSKKWNIDKTIKALEDENIKHFSKLQLSNWLKGELIVALDENREVKINEYVLKYDESYGLKIRKEEDIGE